MNKDITTPSAHRAAPTLEWESLPVVGARFDRRARDRQRLLIALVSMVITGLAAMVLVVTR